MKTLSQVIAAVFVLIFLSAAEASSKEVTISGALVFACDYKTELMEASGFHFYGPGTYKTSKTDFFGVPDGRVVIKNSKGEIIGVTNTNPDGSFSASVAKTSFYEISIDYHGKSIDQVMSAAEALKSPQLSMGYILPNEFPCELK